MSEREVDIPWWVCPAFVIIAFLVGVFIGATLQERTNLREAVKVGVAEWVADSDGKPKFVWITDRRWESEDKQ